MSPVKRVLNISAMVGIFVAALAIGGVVMHAGRLTGQVQGNTDQIKVHKGQIHDIEAIVTKTHTDVEWIRQSMEKEHP